MISLRKITGHFLHAVMGAYGISVTGFLLLHWLVGENSEIIALFNALVLWLLLPSLIFLPVALLMRRYDLCAMLLLPAVVFTIWFAPMFIPRTRAFVPEDAQRLAVMTYNTFGVRDDPEAIAQLIRESQADVVALQEVHIETADYLRRALADVYPYQADSTFARFGVGGKAILSRYPITFYTTWKTGFTHQHAELDVNGTPVTLLNVHVTAPQSGGFRNRNADAEVVLDYARQIEQPVILAGDFNLTERADVYPRIRDVFEDAFARAGLGFGLSYTFQGIPVVRIDYIFYRGDFIVVDAEVVSNRADSDHHPVRAVLVLSS